MTPCPELLLKFSAIAPSQLSGTSSATAKSATSTNATISCAKKTEVKPRPRKSFNDLMRAAGANSKRVVRVIKGTGSKDTHNPYNNPFMRKRRVTETNDAGREEVTKPVKKAVVAKKFPVEKKATAAKQTSKKRGSDDEDDISPAPIAKKRKLVSRKEFHMGRDK